MSKGKTKEIVNRRAAHEYSFLSKHEAGIVLQGPEIKSVRSGHVNLSDAYCHFAAGELYVKSMYIKEYDNATQDVQETRRDRKLLLHRSELKKLERRVKEKGLTLIPYRVYLARVKNRSTSGKPSRRKTPSVTSNA
jgi:SsrA-binding protein